MLDIRLLIDPNCPSVSEACREANYTSYEVRASWYRIFNVVNHENKGLPRLNLPGILDLTHQAYDMLWIECTSRFGYLAEAWRWVLVIP